MRLAIGILHYLIHPDKIYLVVGTPGKLPSSWMPTVQIISNQDGILGGFICGNRAEGLR